MPRVVCGVTQTSQFSVCFRFKPRLLTQSSQKESLPFICTQIFSNVNLFRHFFRPKSTTIYMHLLERNTRSFWYHFLNTVLSYLPQPGRTQTEQAKGTVVSLSSSSSYFLEFRTEFSWLFFLLSFSGFWFFTQYLTMSSDHHPHSFWSSSF